MFAPPPVIKTEEFARLPEALRVKNRDPDSAPLQRLGANRDSFLEGPSFDRDGNLYVVDIPYGRIFKVTPDGSFSVAAEYDGEPNGLKIHKDGRIFIADYKNGIMVMDPASGKVEPHSNRPRLERFKGCNDLVFASNGDIYFTDQGQSSLQDPSGRVFRLRADGELELMLRNIPSPNGLVFNLDESLLFVAVTRGNCVWRAPRFTPGGFPPQTGVFVYLNGGIGPDGMALDQKGNLAVCHPGMGAVWVFNARGEPVYRVDSCTGMATTNVAYGGADGRSLFITESETGTILRAELPEPGQPMYSHM
ncbi:MAG: SMP-30/gluconolactonase/LRE family protein [SAR324 cluster bacterium]|nr:SMP-30/gluconolactonase/LRE family protein [SAR324 cluster bacterium]MCZ6534293.1 SMP-30/gluconolactonase/LRE family protein [SAR324 cluster bacterium]MCZ6627557.1 SMP-30/gluconolactonase/LRE family protein [SAR324 cluster bacterium]MCZ6728517.1 SMP-30/gluconolactonase/LRE family protein [SAR324 cluster bacterium]